MSLISIFANVKITSKNAKYYKELGYEIPYKIDSHGRYVIAVNEEIVVNVNDLPRYSNAKVIMKCDCCGRETSTLYTNYRKSLRENGENYCIKCFTTVINTGENHCMWNPNITIEERELTRRTIPGYTNFIKEVLARDNYTCQCCNKTNCRLEVHHLDGYDWCKEKRCNLLNGISLCKNCHKNFHAKYGKGGNTKQQFEEWLGKSIHLLNTYNGVLPTAREIYCIEEDKIYNSALQFSDIHKIKSVSTVIKTCNCAKILATHPEIKTVKLSEKEYLPKKIKGLHILWLEDYKVLSMDQINTYLQNSKNISRGTKIICLDTFEVFDNLSLCATKYKISSNTIKECCRTQNSHKRRDGKVFNFRFWEEYSQDNKILLNKIQINLVKHE